MFKAYAETLKPLVAGRRHLGRARHRRSACGSASARRFEWLFSPIFIVMQAAPLAALIPLLVMAYGIGLTSKVFVVCIMAMPVIVLNTASAVRNTPVSLKEMGRSFLGERPRHHLQDHHSGRLAGDLLRPAARRLGRLHRRHPGRAQDHADRRRRHHHLQPLDRRLSEHVRRDLLHHPARRAVPEPPGANSRTSCSKETTVAMPQTKPRRRTVRAQRRSTAPSRCATCRRTTARSKR